MSKAKKPEDAAKADAPGTNESEGQQEPTGASAGEASGDGPVAPSDPDPDAPPAPSDDTPEGFAKMAAPEGVEGSVSWGGEAFDVVDGFVVVPADAVLDLAAHGFK